MVKIASLPAPEPVSDEDMRQVVEEGKKLAKRVIELTRGMEWRPKPL